MEKLNSYKHPIFDGVEKLKQDNERLSTQHAKMVEILQDLRNCRETWSDLFQSDKDRIDEVLSSIKKGGSDE